MLDIIDSKILDILQHEGRITNAELAQRIGLTPGPVLTRVSKLESAGFIQRYVAVVDRSALGLGVTAFVSVILKEHDRRSSEVFTKAVGAIPQVLECHHIAGDEDYLLKVVASSPVDYERVILDEISSIKGVQRVKTTFVLSTTKDETYIPVREVTS
ncbi:MAG: Lrp/AsnC family transcriptional regulator [Fimbriimonadaceae bacterium]